MADWSALGNLVTGLMPLVSKPGSGAAAYGQNANAAFQEQQVQEAIRREEKKQQKAKKGALLGGLGSTLGTLAGAALAPLTGGTSLLIPAALGAVGGAVGGAAGELAGSGRVNVGNVANYGVQGALGGFMGGKDAGFGGSGGPVEPGMGPLLDTSISGPVKPTSGAMTKSTVANMFTGNAPQFSFGMGATPPVADTSFRSGLHGNPYVPNGGSRLKLDANTGEYYYTPWGY